MGGQFARSIGIAMVGLAIAATAFGRSLHKAVRLDPVRPAAESPAVEEPTVAEAGERVTEDALRLAVENDPFREAREPSAARYRLPGDVMERPARVREQPEVPAPPFSVLGLLALGDAGYAVVQTEDGTRAVVSLGENVLGYQLTKIEGKTATVSLNGQAFTLSVPDPSMHPEPPSRGRNGRDDERGNRGNNNNQNLRQAEEALQQLREQLLQGRGGRRGGGAFQFDFSVTDVSAGRAGRGGRGGGL
jgi:hypothetical protein